MWQVLEDKLKRRSMFRDFLGGRTMIFKKKKTTTKYPYSVTPEIIPVNWRKRSSV